MDFGTLGISQYLCVVLAQRGITLPTPIQQIFIPEALSSRSILARAHTGSGKTLAYLLPIIQNHTPTQRTLILAPTRELVQQITSVISAVSELHSVAIYGGVEYDGQREALSQPYDIIVATVGRLKDLISQGVVDLKGIERLVLDEVDQMLDLGFRDDILQLSKLRAPRAQTLCLSATISSDVESIVEGIMPLDYLRLEASAEQIDVGRIEQSGYYVTREMMDHLLLHVIRKHPPQRGILFTRSRAMADRLCKLLRDNNIPSEAMHSDRGQSAREHILSRFRSGETHLVVATDIIARGIDVEDVDIVYNYGLPLEAQQYIHRIGRTGRGGKSGRAITLCEVTERNLVDNVCKLMSHHIAMSENHPYSMPTPPPQKRRGRRR